MQPDTWGLKFLSYLKDGAQSPPPSARGQRGEKLQPYTWGLKFVSYLKDGTQSPPPSPGGQRGAKLQLKVGLKFLTYPKDAEFTTLRLRGDRESCNLTQVSVM